MLKINSVIDDYLSRSKFKKVRKDNLLFLKYESIVGKVVAQNTKLLKLSNDTIYIVCKNSIWMNELLNMEDRIISKFNEEIGFPAFSRISLRVGNIKSLATTFHKKLTKEDEDWIIKTCEKVPVEVRSSFEKLLRTYKECKR